MTFIGENYCTGRLGYNAEIWGPIAVQLGLAEPIEQDRKLQYVVPNEGDVATTLGAIRCFLYQRIEQPLNSGRATRCDNQRNSHLLSSESAQCPGDILQLYLAEVRAIPRITPQEEAILARRRNAGDASAVHSLFLANLRLAVSYAKSRHPSALSLLDRIQESNRGLYRAAELFEDKKGCRFSSYATMHMKSAISRAEANLGRTIRLPVHILGKVSKVNSARRILERTLKMKPTQRQVAKYLTWDVRNVQKIDALHEQVRSLDMVIDEGDSNLYTTAAQTSSNWVEDERESREKIKAIASALSGLSKREQLVLKHRFALFGAEFLRLRELAAQLNISLEGVRYIQNNALHKIRVGIKRQELEDFY